MQYTQAEIRTKNQANQVAHALQVIDPSLNEIEANIVSGCRMTWGDIGLEKFAPLTIVGEVMVRAARLAMALVSCKDGIVFVHEIENSMNYSVLPRLWKIIEGASRMNAVQVIGMTHRYRCLKACVSAVEPADVD